MVGTGRNVLTDVDQTSVIAGSLILAFIVFITVRGELTGYLQDLGIVSGETPPAASPITTSSNSQTFGLSSGGGSGGSAGGASGGSSGSSSGGTANQGGSTIPGTGSNPSGGGSYNPGSGNSGGVPPSQMPGSTTLVCPPGSAPDVSGNFCIPTMSQGDQPECAGFIDPNTGACVIDPSNTPPPSWGDTGGGGE